MRLIKGFIMSLGMFSIIPVPKNSYNDELKTLVLPALPLVGALIGLIWYGLAIVISTLSIPLMIKSTVVLFIPFILSGFIHIDGYMDTADAVLARRSREEKKRILKDPHTGAFAVISMAALLIFQFAAVYSIIETQKELLTLAFLPVISRCVTSIASLNIKPVFETGYNASFKNGTKPGHTVFICLLTLISCTAAWFTLGITSLPLLVGAAAGALTIWYLYKQFQGISGDLSGCTIAVIELATLICMALL